MKIETLPISVIKPYWRNPRDNRETIDALMESIKRYGFNVPLVLDADNIIICGHTRFAALKRLGFQEVPCVISDMPADKAKEYRIADNKVGQMSQFDDEKLAAELREITEISGMAPFFSQDELDRLLAQATAPTAPDDVTDDDMAETAEDMADRPEPARLVSVTCPHCGKDFEHDAPAGTNDQAAEVKALMAQLEEARRPKTQPEVSP